MTRIFAFIAAALAIYMISACKKHSNPTPVLTQASGSESATDTCQIRFYVNGVLYNWPDTVAGHDTAYASSTIGYTELPAGQTPSFLHVLDFIVQTTLFGEDGGFSFGLAINSSQATLEEGTYSFVAGADTTAQAPFFVSVGGYFYATILSARGILLNNENAHIFVSDTLAITQISNGYADGTFSATLDSSGGGVLHITDGSFHHFKISD